MSKYFGYWPTVGDLAEDFGVEYVIAGSWIIRGEIPAKYDLKILTMASKRGYSVSHVALQAWHDECSERRHAIREGKVVCSSSKVPHPFTSSKCADRSVIG